MLSRAAVDVEVVGTVKLVDQFPMYELGAAIGLLRDMCNRENESGVDQFYACWQAHRHTKAVLDGDQPLNFCRRAALDLVENLEKLLAEIRNQAPGEEPPKAMPSRTFYTLKKKIDIFEHQLSGDLNKTANYVVPELGIFNVEHLAENADRHIHETIRAGMSEFAIAEYREAGRCLAFGLYSASGFHSARAVENVLCIYYGRFIGAPPDKPMGLLASHLSDLLEKKDCKLKPKENTVRHIRDVVNFDRNPLMHKNITLEEIDATTMFNSALGVIVEMVKELIALDDTDLQETLPLVGAAAVDLGLAAPIRPKRRLAVSAPMKQISDGTKPS